MEWKTVSIDGIRAHALARVNSVLEARGLEPLVGLMAPPNPEMGDLGFPCFPYARVARKAPQAIAQELAEALEADELIASFSAEGPYVNLRFRPEGIAWVVLAEALEDGERFGSGDPDNPLHWVIEYSAPNTNKPQHLGTCSKTMSWAMR